VTMSPRCRCHVQVLERSITDFAPVADAQVGAQLGAWYRHHTCSRWLGPYMARPVHPGYRARWADDLRGSNLAL
jgi:hypothetical protein